MNEGLTHTEKLALSIFQPDTLLSVQYFETCRRKAHLEPEKKLMLAVLEDAVGCFQKYFLVKNENGRRRFEKAEEWIWEENTSWLFSFCNICDVLGFNPDYLRRGLKAWAFMRARL